MIVLLHQNVMSRPAAPSTRGEDCSAIREMCYPVAHW